MRDYWGDTMLERFQPDPVGLPTIWATRPLRDIRISVFNPGTTTLQTIYSSRDWSTTKGNPFTTGDDGYAEFYAAAGGYDIKIEDTQGPARITTKTIGWNAVNGEPGGIPPTQLANGILKTQLEALVQSLLWNTGDIKVIGGAAVPSGWLACDGQAVNRATYNALYTALGGATSPWGQGDGATTFNVPDLKGRALAHAGAPTGDATGSSHVLGARYGAEKHKLLSAESGVVAHPHTISGLSPTPRDHTATVARQATATVCCLTTTATTTVGAQPIAVTLRTSAAIRNRARISTTFTVPSSVALAMRLLRITFITLRADGATRM